jgi:molybdate transport system substrate-binding protein
MKTNSFFLTVLSIALFSCSKARPPAPPPVTLNIFGAASLTESFTNIAAQFESANPGVYVAFNFAGSQQLRAQIEAGAPADVFASANEKEMSTLKSESLVKPETIHDFAANHLVVIMPKNNPAKITTLSDLAKPGIKIDLADASVPVGKYSLASIDKLAADPAYGPQFKTKVLASVVSHEENVKAVLSKVRLGEADAGIVYLTDAASDAGDIITIDIPAKFNPLATYPIAVAAHAPHADLAAKFEDFILSPAGQQVLQHFNFLPAPVATGGH